MMFWIVSKSQSSQNMSRTQTEVKIVTELEKKTHAFAAGLPILPLKLPANCWWIVVFEDLEARTYDYWRLFQPHQVRATLCPNKKFIIM